MRTRIFAIAFGPALTAYWWYPSYIGIALLWGAIFLGFIITTPYAWDPPASIVGAPTEPHHKRRGHRFHPYFGLTLGPGGIHPTFGFFRKRL